MPSYREDSAQYFLCSFRLQPPEGILTCRCSVGTYIGGAASRSKLAMCNVGRNKLVSVNLGPNWKEDCRVKILLDVSMNPDVQLAYNS